MKKETMKEKTVNRSIVKFVSVLAFSLTLTVVILTPVLPQLAVSSKSLLTTPSPTPHPTPHPAPHPTVSPTPHPMPQEGLIEANVPPSDAKRIDPRFIKTNRRPPIPFVPFEMRNPRTNEAIDPNTMFNLRNGQKMTARDYLAGLNELEKKFNELGYSLRDRHTQTPFQEVIINHSELQKQKHEWAAAYSKSNQNEPGTLRKLQVKIPTAGLGKEPVPFTEVSNSNPRTLGETDLLAVSTTGRLILSGTRDQVGVTEDASFDAYIFGEQINLLRMSGEFVAPRSATLNGKLNTSSIFGNILNPINWNDNSSIQQTGNPTQTFNQTFRNVLSVAGYPILVDFKLEAQMGNPYSVYMTPMYAFAFVTPNVQAKVSASAKGWVPIGIPAYVQAGGTVNLLNYRMLILGEMTVGVDGTTANPYYLNNFYGQDYINALSGSFFIRLCFDPVPFFDFDDYCPGWARVDFTWNGINDSGYLFRGSEKIYWTYNDPR